MKVQTYILNSFGKSVDGGNPAGVVLEADNLSEKEMKKIASIIGLSETAFVMKSKMADFKVRFFTPVEEVDICGHATIATFSLLANKGIIESGEYTQETKAGILKVNVNEDLSIMMNQNKPIYGEVLDSELIAETLNISTESFMENLPIQIVSTGLKDIIIPVKSIEILNNIKPNFDAISKVSEKYNVVGYHIFTLETIENSMAQCRNLAPLYGIDEESATGTSNGALACYLFKYGKVSSCKQINITMEQGYSMNKPSKINVELKVKNNEVIDIKVGGSAFNLKEMEFEI
ncbi:PhzF family phenazine biosynthesis protein [Clostridium ihumii]|uniref:PhzF family phenazine biosynthesis protein n=1 Tax=Clostridium ihumii TaxID=1470356 RepID=UPI00058F242D|nr:PhzF family phenazine biosynthesis protein [Clostridium ihumii]